jgi:hypothetical protein
MTVIFLLFYMHLIFEEIILILYFFKFYISKKYLFYIIFIIHVTLDNIFFSFILFNKFNVYLFLLLFIK